MTYAATETSAHGGQPAELYRFTQGARKWLYTSADAPFVHLAETYEPWPLRRGAIRQTLELARAVLEVAAPRDLPFVAAHIASPLIDVVLLTIFRRHRADAQTINLWQGRVSGIRLSGGEATIACEPLATALRRTGLRRPAQRQCPHALYDAGCNVAAAAHAVSGTLLSHTGGTVTASAFAAQPNGWWVGGKIVLSGVLRFVVGHTTDTLTLSGAVPGLEQNAAFTVYPGCDRTPATCNTKFGNIANYGGAPWFPVKNPFSGDAAF